MLLAFHLLFALASPPSLAETVEQPNEGSDEDSAEDSWDIQAKHGPTHTARIATDEGTWMSVSVHGNRVIFDLLGDVWSIPLDGGPASQLTSGPAWDSEPRFSPDGSRIAYVSDADGNEQIWTMNADGSNPKRFTDEKTARVTDPVWDPDGPWIIARRRTIDTRSIGVTELWQYHEDGGSGVALTSKKDHPHAGETTTNGSHVWFSSRQGRFSYDADPLRGLWRIMRLNRNTGDIRAEVSGNGSAVRPMLTPDGNGLVFVSRDRSNTILEHIDFKTRDRRVVADWLDHDQMEGFALHGVYPSMDWTPDGDLVLWAKGKLWRVSLEGDRQEIPFQAEGDWTFHDVPRWPHVPSDTVTAKVNRWASLNRFGDVAYSAMGRLIVESKGRLKDLGPGFSPKWSADGRKLVWTDWTDADNTGRLRITSGRGMGTTQTLPIKGQLLNPALSADGRTIVVLRDPNRDNRPNLGSYPWFELIRLDWKNGKWHPTILDTTVTSGVGFRAPQPTIFNGRIWWLAVGERGDRKPAKSDFISVNMDGTDRQKHLTFPGAVEAIPSPNFSRIAYKLDHQAWIAAMPPLGVHAKIGELPKHKLTETVGDWLNWTPDGQAVTWIQGNILHTLAFAEQRIPDDEDELQSTKRALGFSLKRAQPSDNWAVTGSTVLTMERDGNSDWKTIENATLLIAGDRIQSIEPGGTVPPGYRTVDGSGKTIIPGLIDVHAHLHYGTGDIHPEQPWRYSVNLDFGVTTVHDPSAPTDVVFTHAERVEAGLSVGPRVYSTGYVLYGALGNENAKTPDKDAAFQHVKRLKAVGATSVKVYQQSRRDERQWYVAACNELEMLCIAEGGGDLWMDLTMVADGFQAVEHALPNAPLYNDIHQFMAASRTDTSAGTAYSPTLMVAYGGLSGELHYHQHHSAYDNQRLLRNWDRRDLDAKTRRGRITAQKDDWNHQAIARDCAQMAANGVLVTLGAHGELQGLGVHWELWALGGEGAMKPMDALNAGTMQGARYLGMEEHIGSLKAGKYADFVILNSDPRTALTNTADIHMVVKNGDVVSAP